MLRRSRASQFSIFQYKELRWFECATMYLQFYIVASIFTAMSVSSASNSHCDRASDYIMCGFSPNDDGAHHCNLTFPGTEFHYNESTSTFQIFIRRKDSIEKGTLNIRCFGTNASLGMEIEGGPSPLPSLTMRHEVLQNNTIKTYVLETELYLRDVIMTETYGQVALALKTAFTSVELILRNESRTDSEEGTSNLETNSNQLALWNWKNPVTGVLFAICSSDMAVNVQRLVNVYSNNPTESKYRRACLFRNFRCFTKREGSLKGCEEYGAKNFSCRSIDLKAPGGLISCFRESNGNISESITKEYVVGLDRNYYFLEDYQHRAQLIPKNSVIKVQSINQSFITGLSYDFTCTAASYIFARNLTWSVQYHNSTFTFCTSNGTTVDKRTRELSSLAKIVITKNMKRIICNANYVSSMETVSVSSDLVVVDNQPPSVDKNFEQVVFNSAELNSLRCIVSGIPKPVVQWKSSYLNMSRFKALFPSDNGNASAATEIFFPTGTFNSGDSLKVDCVALNAFGKATKSFIINVSDKNSAIDGNIIAISVTMGLIFAAALAIAVFRFYKNKNMVVLSKEEIEEFLHGNSNPEERGANCGPQNIPYQTEYEILGGSLEMSHKDIIGSGAFGVVYRGVYKGQEAVAIKSLKSSPSKSDVKSLLAELKIMIHIGSHENIVKLIGAVTTDLESGKVLVVMEYCHRGNMEDHLKNLRLQAGHVYTNFASQTGVTGVTDGDANNLSLNTRYDNITLRTNFDSHQLLQWALHIANGMDHLANINVVHGDLATRNVLLSAEGIAKISDFGLSRKLCTYSQYTKQSQDPLPWRWMAIESLTDLIFSTESDVWAYGVTLWEIFSLAQLPFPGLNWNVDFPKQLRKGMRLSKPEYASKEVYALMMRCWNPQPTERPRFSTIRSNLAALCKSADP